MSTHIDIQPDRFLEVKDELNLYLVAHGLKPTADIPLNPRNPVLNPIIEVSEDPEKKIKQHTLTLKPEDAVRFRDYLNQLGVVYIENLSELIVGAKATDQGELIEVTKSKALIFNVAVDKESLDRLIKAKTDEEIGMAYGYPKEAAAAYGKVIDEVKRDNAYELVQLAKAKIVDVSIPTWLAYISHVVEQLDLVNGFVSLSSIELGEKYQSYVRAHNPNLAERVEKEFLDTLRRTQVRWELRSDKSYEVLFI